MDVKLDDLVDVVIVVLVVREAVVPLVSVPSVGLRVDVSDMKMGARLREERVHATSHARSVHMKSYTHPTTAISCNGDGQEVAERAGERRGRRPSTP